MALAAPTQTFGLDLTTVKEAWPGQTLTWNDTVLTACINFISGLVCSRLASKGIDVSPSAFNATLFPDDMVRVQDIAVNGIAARYAIKTGAATAAYKAWADAFDQGMRAIDERPTDLAAYSLTVGSGTLTTHATTEPPNDFQRTRPPTTRTPWDWAL